MKMKQILLYLIASCYLLMNPVGAISVILSKNPDRVQAGSTLSLTCSVDEDPAPLIQVLFSRNNFDIVVVSPVSTCYKGVVATDDPAAYTLTCDPDNKRFKLNILSVDSSSHGHNWTCRMTSGSGGPCFGTPSECVSGSVSVFIPVPVTTVRLTNNNGNSVTSPVDVSESSNGLILKCNTGPTGSRPVADIIWWKTGRRITANVTSIPATSLGNNTYISNTRLVVGDRSYNGLNVYCTASQVRSGEVQLNVKWRPDVSLQIVGQSYTVYKVLESQTNVVFTCISGPVNPAITGYSWQHNSNAIVNEVTNTYTISSVSQSYDGLYTCSATNMEGTGTSIEMDLDVLYGPSINAMTAVSLEETEHLNTTCTGRGNPTPSFHWKFGSQTLSNNAVLEIQRISSDQGGIYTCHASNTLDPSVGPAVDKTISTTLNVAVYYGPKSVNVSPLTLGIEEGQKTTTPAMCSADCKPTCEYRWYKNGGTNPADVGNTLDLGIVNRNTTGNYTCEAHNRFLNRNRSQRADVPLQVQIYFPPDVKLQADQHISPPPTPYRIILGQTNVRLRCVLDQANPQPTSYTWMFNSTEIAGENQATFNIQNVALQNHGTFGCRANNGIGTPSFSYLLVDVQYGPIITPINNQTKDEGSQLTMPCQFTANPQANIIRWSKKNNSTFEKNQATLTIAQLDRTDRGLYICYIQNTLLLSGGPSTGELKTSSEDMYLDVQYKPAITSLHINGDDVINENDTDTTIVCEVDSNPAPHILWTRGHNHSSLPDTGTNLIIPRAQCSDTTIFTCTASNGVGLTVRKSVPLYVNCQPRINLHNQSERTVYGAIGESIKVTVHDIVAYPPPMFTWKKEDTDRLPPSNQTDTNTSSTLTLHQLELSTFGNYSVSMDNKIGDPFTVYITVESASHPLEPTNLAVITSTTNSVTLTWTPGFNGGADQTFHIQYRKAGDVDFVNHSKTFLDDLSISMSGTIVGLQESTVYNFRLISRNRFGGSPVSEGVQGTTGKSSSNETNIGAIAGGAAGGALAIALIAGIAVFLIRHKRNNKGTNKSKSTKEDTDQLEFEDVSTPNSLYQSAGPSNETYAQVDLKKKKKKTMDVQPDGDLYAVVNKSKAKKTGAENSVYENPQLLSEQTPTSKNDVYANQPAPPKRRNQDGLIYVDLDLGPKKNVKGKAVIHGLDDATEYAEVAFGKKGPPPPPDLDD